MRPWWGQVLNLKAVWSLFRTCEEPWLGLLQIYVIKMYAGTIRNLTEMGNEIWAMLAGFKSVFTKNENKVELESDNHEAIKEWEDRRWFVDSGHGKVI